MAAKLRIAWPAIVALLVGGAYVAWRLSQAAWDPLALAELGGGGTAVGEAGMAGYDGQFAYYLALDPSPEQASQHLDDPAYRYQRILYPLLARFLAFGSPQALPWVLIGVNLLAHALGTGAVAWWLHARGVWPGFALTYAGWVGLVSGVGLDLNEPLAFALVAGAWLASARGRGGRAAALMAAALFTKESTILFWAAMLVGEIADRRRPRAVWGLVAAGAMFAAWQLWLRATFGAFGLGIGGAGATPFDWIPLMGLWRIGGFSLAAMGLFAAIFGPTIVGPSLWGVAAAVRAAWRGQREAETWALLFNAGAVVFVPFSTFREPLGLVRFSCGLVLATLFFAGSGRLLRPLRYSLFWSALLVMLLSR